MKGGRCLNSCPFYVGEVSASSRIPSVQRKPVRFLGRIINGSLTDRNSTDELEEKLRDGIKLIDKSAHSGLDKVWILQFLLVPQIRWPLMIYEVPFNRVKILEQFISKHIRKWLRLHHSISDVCLYSDHSPCPLPLSSLTSIFKSTKVSAYLQLRDRLIHVLVVTGNPVSL